MNECHSNINMLLYVNDVVIVGGHIGRVQKVLNTLSEFARSGDFKLI